MTQGIAAALWVMAQCALAQPYLILHDFFAGPAPTPAFIKANYLHLDTLPFDGFAVYLRDPAMVTNVSASVYAPRRMSHYDIYKVMYPMIGIPFRSPKHNFGLMFAGPGIDAFDDALWSVRLENMRIFARVLKDTGFDGIFFDNENYSDWARYGGKGCAAPRTLTECQTQMRLRGRQVMEALVSEFPGIMIICLIGPWVSDYTFYERTGLNNVAEANHLTGPFFVGLVEGKGEFATVVDGGEFYSSRTLEDFRTRYYDQKFYLPSAPNGPPDLRTRAGGPSGFIPSHLRPFWSSNVSASAGIYDRDTGMTPASMQAAVANALSCVDRIVWVYTEGVTFLVPPGQHPVAATAEWIDAVRSGKAAERKNCRP